MEKIDSDDNKENGLAAKAIDKDVAVESPSAFEDAVVMDSDSNGIEAQKTIPFDQRSVGETIDDIVNELKSSGVVVDVDVSGVSSSARDTEILCTDVIKLNGTGNGNRTPEEQRSHEVTSVATTLSLPSLVSSDEDKGTEKDDMTNVATEQEVQEKIKESLVEEQPVVASLTEVSDLEERVVISETEAHERSQNAEITRKHGDGAQTKTGKQSDGAGDSDDEGKKPSLSRRSRGASATPKSNAGSTPKQPRKRSRTILKVSVASMMRKKPAVEKTNKLTVAAERPGPKHTKRSQQVLEKDDGSDNDSHIQTAKRSRTVRDTAEEEESETKVVLDSGSPERKVDKATKKRSLQRKSKKNDDHEENKGTGGLSIKSSPVSEDQRIQTAERSGKMVAGVEGDGKSKVHDDTKRGRKTVKAMKPSPRTKKVPKETTRNEEETEVLSCLSVKSDYGSSISEVCDWSFEEFVASDGYLKDVIGRSLGSTNGRFLTIELPDVDMVKRNRVWRTKRTRRSRPVVFGGCDPNRVYVDVMGVKVPIYCWSQFDHIMPKVLVTDIFEYTVQQYSTMNVE